MIRCGEIIMFTVFYFCIKICFRTLGVLFSTVVTGTVVANLVILDISPLAKFVLTLREGLIGKLVTLGISFLISFVLVLKVILVAKLVISGFLSSIFLILALYAWFLITSLVTAYLSLLKSIGAGTNLSRSNLSTLLLMTWISCYIFQFINI